MFHVHKAFLAMANQFLYAFLAINWSLAILQVFVCTWNRVHTEKKNMNLFGRCTAKKWRSKAKSPASRSSNLSINCFNINHSMEFNISLSLFLVIMTVWICQFMSAHCLHVLGVATQESSYVILRTRVTFLAICMLTMSNNWIWRWQRIFMILIPNALRSPRNC